MTGGMLGSTTVRIAPRGPFSLAQASRFFRGWSAESAVDGMLPLAMVADDLASVAGVAVRADRDSVVCEITGTADPERVAAQISRIFSLDHDATGFVAVGAKDAVLGERIAAAPGLRPVLFHSPYEAGIWAILSQRVSVRQASALRARLGDAIGQRIVVAGVERAVLPTPAALLAASELPSGIPAVKAERLRALAEAALTGRLDAARLRALSNDAAREELLELPGIGPFSADLILMRSTGVTDAFSVKEPRVRAAISTAYGVPNEDSNIEQVAERWRPWRTWAGVLFRATESLT